MIRKLAAPVLAAAPASAQSVEECDWRADMRFIAEPWAENTRTFSNGAVRLVRVDTWEPAAIPFQIVVISPPYGEEGWPQCRAIGAFAEIDFAALDAGYDPAVGLQVAVPVEEWVSDMVTRPRLLRFTLNQATGALTARLEDQATEEPEKMVKRSRYQAVQIAMRLPRRGSGCIGFSAGRASDRRACKTRGAR